AMVIMLVMLAISASPKEKKEIIPALILRAQYVAVIVDPEAGISVANPGEDGIARSDVEAALEKWGRFKLTVNPENEDLVVVVRDAGPVWRAIAHDGRQHPTVTAVQKFRKAIEEAEKTRKP